MCGRFAITLPPDAMAMLFEARPDNDLPAVPNYNVCPTDPIHVIRSEDGARRLVALRWGLIPPWYKAPNDGPPLFNARAETVAEKPAFRGAARARRCLIPASGFYEWTKDAAGARLPWYIRAADAAPLAFAGLWQDWTKGDETRRTCTIVTCAAAGEITAIHHRMPVIVARDHWAKWLGEAGRGAATLMRPAPEGSLVMHRVSPAVNSNRAAGPDLIAPNSA